MPLQGVLLSLVIVFVSSETDILLSEPPDVGLWYWTIRTDSQGAGWIHPSIVKPRYKVCDISDGIKKEPSNWLQTDFIDVKNATRLDIEIHYSLLNCPTTSTSQYCKTYLTLYSYNTDTKNPIPDPAHGMFQKEAIITPNILPSPGRSVKDIFRGSVITKAKGLYLAFLDQGVCVTLSKVVISYRYCPERGSTLVIFPRTVAPANDSDLSEQEGKCTDVNSVSKANLSAVCHSNGEWDITDDLMCLCKAGYELVNGTITSLECKECPSGSYKSTINNTKCLQCPLNSASNAEKTGCTCDVGFYKFKTVLEGCKALPLAPLKANKTVVNGTYVVISWHRSPDDNGKLTYAVDCFRCKSREEKNCTETCDQQLRYLPGKENITGVNVTVNSLSSSSLFLFRVYSVNELNQQEKDMDKWKFAEVFVETEDSPTAAPKTVEASPTSVPITDKALTTSVPNTDKASTSAVPRTSAHTKAVPRTEDTNTATAMYLKIIYGLVGLLIALIASLIIFIVFKRLRHKKKAKRIEVSITNESGIAACEDICELRRVCAPYQENVNFYVKIYE